MSMDLATIEMPQEQAEALLVEYRGQLATERTRQDERIAAGYRALARGLPVLKLSESLARGGFFDNGLPRIAVVRADETVCTVRYETGRVIFYGGDPELPWRLNRGALVNRNSVLVNITRPRQVEARPRWQGRTTVPIIPPRFRPKPNRLHWFHILWEVEEWELIPPRDPALLRHIGGDLWAVMATWNLTEIERAVLGGH